MAEIIKMFNGTYRIEDNGVRAFLIEGTERALLIDTCMRMPEIRRIAEELTNLPLSLLNTHADPDHISGNKAFERFYMSPAEEENYRSHGGIGEIIPVRSGDIIELGGRTLMIIDNPGHTPGSIAVLDVNNRILISGDAVQNGNIYMFSQRRNMALYLNSLKQLRYYLPDFDYIYPSHGSIPIKPEIIDDLISAAESVISGKAMGEPVSMYSGTVMLYKFPCAGFLCDMPE